MPVTSGTYAENERTIFYQLTAAGLGTAAACGVLANLQAESGFNPMNLQNSYESSLGYKDKSYTDAVDSGTYKKFSSDSAGYGLAQWTFSSRKAELLNYVKNIKKKSIGDLTSQIEFLIIEMKKSYNKYPGGVSLWNLLASYGNTGGDAQTAAYIFCKDFERPANPNAPTTRGNLALEQYWPHYRDIATTIKPVENVGDKIVAVALEQAHNAVKYTLGGNSPTTGFDDSGLVYYVYNKVGIKVEDLDADDLYKTYTDTAKHVPLEEIAAGDLLFYKDSINGSYRVSIASSKNNQITVNEETLKVLEENRLTTPTTILRILSDVQVGSYDISNTYTPAQSYNSVSIVDPYSAIATTNLSRVRATGYDYGYLFDMNHGGEFRFYVPEFTEHAGANWGNVEIRGRSASVLSYEHTNSRVVTVNLDLYAGAGIYSGLAGETLEDAVDRLHKDINFVKSLEYPDYQDAVVRPPATVHLILGASVDFIGVVSDVSVEHLKPLDSYNRSVYIKMSFTVTQIAPNPPDYKDIRNGSASLSTTEKLSTLYSGGTTLSKDTNAPVYSGNGPVSY